MYVHVIPNRSSPPAILLREGYRDENGKLKNRTLANLSHWPAERIEALRQALKGGAVGPPLAEAFSVARTRPHGHVAAVLGTAYRLGLDRVVGSGPGRARELALAMVARRVIEPEPGSKLACARGLSAATLDSTLGEVLEVEGADEDDLYEAMDWLVSQQDRIENTLARRHLSEGTLVLYNVSSAALEGRHCDLGQIGYARDGVKGRLQIVYGLLTNKEGCPVAVQVFEGKTGDPSTIPAQVAKIKERFKLSTVVLVGDRGMITKARINEDLRKAELDWITALRAPAIKQLAERKTVQLGLFDETNLVEVTDPEYPGERLIACRNPILAEERRRKREALLVSTEAQLAAIEAATKREKRRLKGAAKIGVRVGRVINHYKVAKHFILEIGEVGFSFRRDEARIAEEAALDGIYVIWTSVQADTLSSTEVVSSYKRLQRVERAFRIFNGDLDVRPIYHRKANRVRAHLLICMLSHYVEWHMQRDLAPLMFAEEDLELAALRPDPISPPKPSPTAAAKAAKKRTADGLPAQSFRSLLRDLATIAVNRVQPLGAGPPFDKVTTPTEVQARALALLGVSERLGFERRRRVGARRG